MPQFETEVPDPLREDLPKLLTPGGMRAPAIRILLLIFITEYALERSPVQIESHDIGRRERSLRQGCVEQLVDHRSTCGTDLRRELGRRMGGDDDPCVWPDGRKREIREVKECSTRSRGADGSSAGLGAASGGTGLLAYRGDRSLCPASHSKALPDPPQ
jgi:hypothetical protein